MNGSRLDAISRAFATRRLSRRAALAAGSLGLVAAGATGSASRRGGSAAQDATPAASPAAGPAAGDGQAEFLFVQTFAGGTLVPKPGEDGVFVLTLTGGADQTVYFSDRPERIVGTVPMAQFLDTLGFTPDNPPNAAVVAQTAAGEDIAVVELLNPRLTQTFGTGGTTTLAYDVRILENYQEEGLAHLAARQQDAELPESLGPTSLFIDDCPDTSLVCLTPDGVLTCSPLGNVYGVGTCWVYWTLSCDLCSGSPGDICNAALPACNGECTGKTFDEYEDMCLPHEG